jgi:hypothetical protein
MLGSSRLSSRQGFLVEEIHVKQDADVHANLLPLKDWASGRLFLLVTGNIHMKGMSDHGTRRAASQIQVRAMSRRK